MEQRRGPKKKCMCVHACVHVWGRPWRLGSLSDGRRCAAEVVSATKRGAFPAPPATVV